MKLHVNRKYTEIHQNTSKYTKNTQINTKQHQNTQKNYMPMTRWVGGMRRSPLNPPRHRVATTACQTKHKGLDTNTRSVFLTGYTKCILYWACAPTVLKMPYLTALFENFQVLPRGQHTPLATDFSFGGVAFPILAPFGVSLDSSWPPGLIFEPPGSILNLRGRFHASKPL